MPSFGSTLTGLPAGSPYDVLTRSTTHPPSFRAYPRVPPYHLPQILALKTILVDDRADPAPATVIKTSHYSSSTIDLHIRASAPNHIGGKRNRKIYCRTHWNVGIHAEQNTIRGNILGLTTVFSITVAPRSQPGFTPDWLKADVAFIATGNR